MHNHYKLPGETVFLIFISILTVCPFYSFSTVPDQKTTDSIFKLMYDRPSTRDTVHMFYDKRLNSCPVPRIEKTIATTQGQTHLIIWGDTNNPPMIILHGWQADATLWIDIAPFLARSFCLYAPDIIYEPSGKSIPCSFPAKREDYTNWLKELTDSLKINKPYLAGISLGSMIAADFVIKYLDIIRKVVFISPSAGIAKTRIAAIFKLMKIWFFAGDQKIKKTLDAMRSPTVKSDDDLYNYLGYLMNHCKTGIPMPPWQNKDEELCRIYTESLVLIGSDEIFVNPNKSFKRAKKFMPNVQTELVKDAGHYSIGDQPKEISERIIRFCKE
jgi:pimeloyl-ACP methyl ester carboxylesterase